MNICKKERKCFGTSHIPQNWLSEEIPQTPDACKETQKYLWNRAVLQGKKGKGSKSKKTKTIGILPFLAKEIFQSPNFCVCHIQLFLIYTTAHKSKYMQLDQVAKTSVCKYMLINFVLAVSFWKNCRGNTKVLQFWAHTMTTFMAITSWPEKDISFCSCFGN